MKFPNIASFLKSATTNINIASAPAPSKWQVLTATSSTTATWQTPQSTFVAWGNITATSWQTVFTVPTYVTNRINIYVNWLLQTKTIDYNEINSTTITMTTWLVALDEFKYIIL